MQSKCGYLLLLSFLLLEKSATFDLKGFDDTILYQLNWGKESAELLETLDENDSYIVTSHNKEKYKCFIPSLLNKESEEDGIYAGPTPLDLLKPLFMSSACSYRIESYWTYEICHGNYIKQYHEEREGKIMKTQEYYLGKWDKAKTEALRLRLEKAERDNEKTKLKKIEGLSLPVLEMEMSDGTMCDLNNEPRRTKILYVCYPHVKNEIYSLKETSTCNYEVIVLTPSLCAHPKYEPQESGENFINCLPMEGAPDKPRSMMTMDVENMKLRYQRLTDAHKSAKETVAVFKVDTQDGTLRMELIQPNELNFNKGIVSDVTDVEGESFETSAPQKKHFVATDMKDTSPVEAFLQGKNCLNGGTGWWKYEFCYGRYVRQYHTDKNGETSVILGFFDEKSHLEWIKNNPHKRPKPIGKRTQITHFYQSGSVCDKTGKKRSTEVKLKCLENSSSPASVSLYLLEPQTCQYILGVESPLICDILQKADENGLISRDNFGDVPTDETPAEYIVENTRLENN